MKKNQKKIKFVDFIRPFPNVFKKKVKTVDKVLVLDLEFEEYVRR